MISCKMEKTKSKTKVFQVISNVCCGCGCAVGYKKTCTKRATGRTEEHVKLSPKEDPALRPHRPKQGASTLECVCSCIVSSTGIHIGLGVSRGCRNLLHRTQLQIVSMCAALGHPGTAAPQYRQHNEGPTVGGHAETTCSWRSGVSP